jgi:hypothetical protein
MGPKFAAPTGIQAEVMLFQRQGVFSGQVTRHGVSRLTISQVLGVLHDAAQHQPPWGSRRLPSLRIKMDKILVGQENAEFVAQAEQWRTFGKGRESHAGGLSRNLWNRGRTQHFSLCAPPWDSPAESVRFRNPGVQREPPRVVTMNMHRALHSLPISAYPH